MQICRCIWTCFKLCRSFSLHLFYFGHAASHREESHSHNVRTFGDELKLNLHANLKQLSASLQAGCRLVPSPRGKNVQVKSGVLYESHSFYKLFLCKLIVCTEILIYYIFKSRVFSTELICHFPLIFNSPQRNTHNAFLVAVLFCCRVSNNMSR